MFLVIGLVALGVVSASAAGNLPTGASDHQLSFDGLDRTYRLYVPESVKAHPAVVLVLHGGFGVGNGAIQQGHWDTAADEHGFVVVAPDGRSRSWNAGDCCGPAKANGVDDVGFLLAVIDEVLHMVGGDRGRVYATGISNGGMMSYRLACEAADTFAAIAPVAADLVVDDCAPSRPISLLHIHGLTDRNVPFEGGKPTKTFQPNPPTYEPVRDGIDLFVKRDRCRNEAQLDTNTVDTVRFTRCRKHTAVELITIADGGHSWPGGDRMAQLLDLPSNALDATARIVKFLEAHHR